MSEMLHALFDWFQSLPERHLYLVPTAHGSTDEYTLYCSCCHPPASSQWKWSDMKAFAVAKAAHERGYGSGAEIVPVGERRSSQSADRAPIRSRFPRRKIS